MTEMAYIVTFLGKVHTTATVKDITDVKNIKLIADTERILVFPGELISTDSNRYTKQYKVKLSEVNEAGLYGMLNDIIDGCNDLNGRITIDGYTKPGVLISGKIKHSNRAYEDSKTRRWEMDIIMEFKWATS